MVGSLYLSVYLVSFFLLVVFVGDLLLACIRRCACLRVRAALSLSLCLVLFFLLFFRVSGSNVAREALSFSRKFAILFLCVCVSVCVDGLPELRLIVYRTSSKRQESIPASVHVHRYVCVLVSTCRVCPSSFFFLYSDALFFCSAVLPSLLLFCF